MLLSRLTNFPLNKVSQFLARQKHSKKFILVHCTHGHNRTGYMIVHYLMRTLPISVTQVSFFFLNNYLIPFLYGLFSNYQTCPSCRQYKYLRMHALRGYTNQTILMPCTLFIMRKNLKQLFALQHLSGRDLANLIWMVTQCQMKMMMVLLLLLRMYVYGFSISTIWILS